LCDVAAPLISDHNNFSTPVKASLPINGQSWTLVTVNVILTAAGLSLVVFLLQQLDIIFSRQSSFNIRSVSLFLACCSRWFSVGLIQNADKIKQQARLLTTWTLLVYTGVLDAFVTCEFTEVRTYILCTWNDGNNFKYGGQDL